MVSSVVGGVSLCLSIPEKETLENVVPKDVK